MRAARIIIFSTLLAGSLLSGTAAFCQPDSSSAKLPFAAAQQVAGRVYAAVAEQRPIPDSFQVTGPDGKALKLTAAQGLGLLAAAAESIVQGKLAPLPRPQDLGTPLNTEDQPARSAPVTILAQALLNEARPLQDFAAAMGAFPSAIWIGGERLNAAEFMQGIASIVKFQDESGHLPRRVRIVPCEAPSAWTLGLKPTNGNSAPVKGPMSVPPLEVTPTNLAAANRDAAALSIFPGDGAEVDQQGEIVAALASNAEKIAIFFYVDGRLRGMSNWSPFTFHLGGSQVTPGPHRIKIRAENGEGKVIASREISVTVTVGPSPAAADLEREE